MKNLALNGTNTQAYDPEKGMFLSDRFIKGTCPKCDTPDQYGDNCEACGATYTPMELIDPKLALSGATPEERDSEHYFFTLPDFADFLHEWTRSDVPYFGFEIPDAPGKYLYVWLDAPIGYLASFRKPCNQRGDLDFCHGLLTVNGQNLDEHRRKPGPRGTAQTRLPRR